MGKHKPGRCIDCGGNTSRGRNKRCAPCYALISGGDTSSPIKAIHVNRARQSFYRACRPRHVWSIEQFSPEWFRICDAQFQRAMRDNPDTRPSAGQLPYNGAGSGR